MSRIVTVLKKLKKRKYFSLLNIVVCGYLYFSRINQSALISILPFITPTNARKLLDKYRKSLTKQECEHLLGEINKFDQGKRIEPTVKMKIAICLSGEPRSYIHCIESFKRFFHGHDIDIYIASKNEHVNEDLMAQYNTKNVNTYSDPSFKELEAEGFKKFGFKSERDGLLVANASPNLYPMWYGVYKSVEYLINNPDIASQYDAICRCRFDNFFIKPMDITSFPKNSIFVDPNYNEHNGFSDHLAIGEPESMIKYLSLFNWIEESFLQDFGEKGYLPERVLKKYLLEHCKINVVPYEFESRLFRDSFVGLPSYKIPLKDFKINRDRNVRLNKYIKDNYPEFLPVVK